MNTSSRRTLLKTLPAGLALSGPARAADGKLKITRFVLHKMTLRWRDLLFVEIHTDGGLIGLGEGSLHTRVEIVEQAIKWLEPHLVGLDPAGVEDLWDLEGKRLGVPVWRLLGGPIHSRLRVYYTHWNNTMRENSPEAFARRAIQTREKGWTAVKWAIPRAQSESERIEFAIQRVAAVRKAGGPHFDICLELFESLTTRSAIRFAEAMAPYRPMFIEEPLPRENPAAFTELAAKSAVPIATGEGLLSRYEFRQLLEAKGAAIVQPDVMHCGGITEMRKIANLAETYGVELAPHQCGGPVGHVASLAAASVCRNFLIHEWEADDDALFQELTGGKYPAQKNGVVALPEGPGLGLTVNFAELKKRFPFKTLTS
jgi:galactonate dehydratase